MNCFLIFLPITTGLRMCSFQVNLTRVLPFLASVSEKNSSQMRPLTSQLNLASQSVLESLNSVFDHRGRLFVPELGRYFDVDRERTKIFACQNPVQQGGGRKGLPKSFLNRFTQVILMRCWWLWCNTAVTSTLCDEQSYKMAVSNALQLIYALTDCSSADNRKFPLLFP